MLHYDRNAVKDDKRKEFLKLDNALIKLKTSSSDGKVDKSRSIAEETIPYRAHSCHIPYTTSIDRITDFSVKGVSAAKIASFRVFTSIAE